MNPLTRNYRRSPDSRDRSQRPRSQQSDWTIIRITGSSQCCCFSWSMNRFNGCIWTLIDAELRFICYKRFYTGYRRNTRPLFSTAFGFSCPIIKRFATLLRAGKCSFAPCLIFSFDRQFQQFIKRFHNTL